MPYKDPVKRNEANKVYRARYYAKNKAQVKAQARLFKKKQKAEWDAFKASQSCSHCGAMHPAGIILDFHHVIRENKKSVNVLLKNGRYSAAMEEIKKCIPLCANCHRILHWEEREDYKREKKRKKALKGAKVP